MPENKLEYAPSSDGCEMEICNFSSRLKLNIASTLLLEDCLKKTKTLSSDAVGKTVTFPLSCKAVLVDFKYNNW
jgi:hypothetical protein